MKIKSHSFWLLIFFATILVQTSAFVGLAESASVGGEIYTAPEKKKERSSLALKSPQRILDAPVITLGLLNHETGLGSNFAHDPLSG
jgi:hypothetical protein